MSIERLIRSDLLNFAAYSSARDEAREGKIWLNANESPWDHGNNAYNRYPSKQPSAVIEKLAPIYGVTPEELALFRGSDEAIDLLIRLFCRAEKDAILICPPTFGMYKVYAELQGAKTISVPLSFENNFQLDLPAIFSSWTPNTKLIFICSPNNPTGNIIPAEDIFVLCEHFADKSIIVVDEAYIEYAETESLARKIGRYENLAILRTFSKAYGLAAARCGALLAQPQIIKWLNKIVAPYPLPASTVEIIAQSIIPENQQKIHQKIREVQSEKKRLMQRLQTLPAVTQTWESDANFILIRTQDAEKVMGRCMQAGIVLRSMHNRPGLENCIRITIGTPFENDFLAQTLKQI